MKKGTKRVSKELPSDRLGVPPTTPDVDEKLEKIEHPEYSVGDVLVSEKEVDGKNVLSPVVIYGIADDGKFKLANETHVALNTTFTPERLAELGYTVVTHVDLNTVQIKPARKIVKSETVAGSSGELRLEKEPGTPEPKPEKAPTTPVAPPAGEPEEKAARTTRKAKAEAPAPATFAPAPASGRKLIQISASMDKGISLYGLADDGTAWKLTDDESWHQIAGLA